MLIILYLDFQIELYNVKKIVLKISIYVLILNREKIEPLIDLDVDSLNFLGDSCWESENEKKNFFKNLK